MKKKLIVALVVFAVVTFAASADSIQLGNFPVGQWLDTNYNVIWDFTSSNIRILSTNGAVLYDFADKTIENFKVFVDGTQPGISFSCVESGRSYRFMKPLTNSDVVMEIARSHLPDYSVAMKKQ